MKVITFTIISVVVVLSIITCAVIPQNANWDYKATLQTTDQSFEIVDISVYFDDVLQPDLNEYGLSFGTNEEYEVKGTTTVTEVKINVFAYSSFPFIMFEEEVILTKSDNNKTLLIHE